jgi:hypothetical protein
MAVSVTSMPQFGTSFTFLFFLSEDEEGGWVGEWVSEDEEARWRGGSFLTTLWRKVCPSHRLCLAW